MRKYEPIKQAIHSNVKKFEELSVNKSGSLEWEQMMRYIVRLQSLEAFFPRVN